MSLTTGDLQAIQKIVTTSNLKLKTELNNMESRIVMALGLVERDHDLRLGDLERRVSRLERAS